MAMQVNVKGVTSGMDNLKEKIVIASKMYASTKATQIESYAKGNRPWTDRTGLAKANIRATVSQPQSNYIRITLSHGVDYGIWLELANEKRYAIVKPTIDKFGPEVYSGLKSLLSKVKV